MPFESAFSLCLFSSPTGVYILIIITRHFSEPLQLLDSLSLQPQNYIFDVEFVPKVRSRSFSGGALCLSKDWVNFLTQGAEKSRTLSRMWLPQRAGISLGLSAHGEGWSCSDARGREGNLLGVHDSVFRLTIAPFQSR